MSRTLAAAGTLPYNPAAVHFAADSAYYAGANGSGLSALGTVCAVFRLAGLPDNAQRLFFSRAPASVAGGWLLATAVNSVAAKLACVYRTGAATVTSPEFLFTADDVGKCFVVHATYEGAAVRLYVQGVEHESGTAGAAPVGAGAGEGLRVGNFEALGGFNNPYIDPIALLTSTAAITPADVLTHALAIIGSRARAIPALASEAERYIAGDLLPSAPAAWPDRDTTASVDLTKAGAPTVYRV